MVYTGSGHRRRKRFSVARGHGDVRASWCIYCTCVTCEHTFAYERKRGGCKNVYYLQVRDRFAGRCATARVSRENEKKKKQQPWKGFTRINRRSCARRRVQVQARGRAEVTCARPARVRRRRRVISRRKARGLMICMFYAKPQDRGHHLCAGQMRSYGVSPRTTFPTGMEWLCCEIFFHLHTTDCNCCGARVYANGTFALGLLESGRTKLIVHRRTSCFYT